MCGFVGVLKKQGVVNQDALARALLSLRHRGPNDQGMWIEDGMGLAHVRLSIHDLSSTGHQPMMSNSGKWIIAYNGEIYNYIEVKQELLKSQSIHFKGTSDTEVLINAIELWGIEKSLSKCRGMFAFAAWNRETKQLYLARDRFGEKPLYYGIIQEDLIFASELKALQTSYQDDLEIDRDVLTSYLRFSYVPTPYSIYKNIYKLDAGCYLKISQNHQIIKKTYWDACDVIQAKNRFSGSYQDAVDTLEAKLKNTISLQMASDVPLGAFLSGGIDSSTIVALMQAQSKDKIKTFSIGFTDKRYNEAKFAKGVAERLDTHHTELYVDNQDVFDVIPRLPGIYDEPFADSSQIPTYLVSKIAKAHVSVCLSGDAGDELFGGYNRYLFARMVKRKILEKRMIRNIVTHTPIFLFKLLDKFSFRYNLLLDKLMKLQAIIKHSSGSPYNLYTNLCSQTYQPRSLVLQGYEPSIYQEKGLCNLPELTYEEWMMFADSKTYMIDDILTKVDRASMAVSLETRIPFLDHHIYEFAWSLPIEYKIKNRIGKRVLKDVLSRYVPRELIDRPKMGFGIPLEQWLRGTLKEWAADLLSPNLLQRQAYLNAEIIQRYWQEHQSGKRNWAYLLWNVLMFQAWLVGIRGNQ